MTALEFRSCVVYNSKYLKPFALKLTQDKEDALDLLQDTILKAFMNKDKFMEGTNLRAWLYTIMRNTFFTQYQRMVRKKTMIDNTEDLHFINSGTYTVQNNAYGEFVMEDIQKAISILDDSLRTPFLMHYRGHKYNEIAEELQIPIGTVKNRIHLARKELKSYLTPYATTN